MTFFCSEFFFSSLFSPVFSLALHLVISQMTCFRCVSNNSQEILGS